MYDDFRDKWFKPTILTDKEEDLKKVDLQRNSYLVYNNKKNRYNL